MQFKPFNSLYEILSEKLKRELNASDLSILSMRFFRVGAYRLFRNTNLSILSMRFSSGSVFVAGMYNILSILSMRFRKDFLFAVKNDTFTFNSLYEIR